MIVGIICAIIIYVLTNAFAGLGWNVGYAALPVAVIIGVILMCAAEKLPYANNVAAIFMGAALYFAIMGTRRPRADTRWWQLGSWYTVRWVCFPVI